MLHAFRQLCVTLMRPQPGTTRRKVWSKCALPPRRVALSLCTITAAPRLCSFFLSAQQISLFCAFLFVLVCSILFSALSPDSTRPPPPPPPCRSCVPSTRTVSPCSSTSASWRWHKMSIARRPWVGAKISLFYPWGVLFLHASSCLLIFFP